MALSSQGAGPQSRRETSIHFLPDSHLQASDKKADGRPEPEGRKVGKMTLRELMERTDYFIVNNGTAEELFAQINLLINKIR